MEGDSVDIGAHEMELWLSQVTSLPARSNKHDKHRDLTDELL